MGALPSPLQRLGPRSHLQLPLWHATPVSSLFCTCCFLFLHVCQCVRVVEAVMVFFFPGKIYISSSFFGLFVRNCS